MSGFLIDTNVISELARPKPAPGVIAFFQRETNFWLSVITLHELAYGAERVPDPARKTKLLAWIAEINAEFGSRILPLDTETAENAGRLRALANAQGRPAEPLDALIAATALSHGSTLVTRNTKDFAVFAIRLVNPWGGSGH